MQSAQLVAFHQKAALPPEHFGLVTGGVGPVGATVGGVVAGATYLGSAVTSGTGSFSGFASAVFGGAVIGFLSPIGAGALRVGATLASGVLIGVNVGAAAGTVEKVVSDLEKKQ